MENILRKPEKQISLVNKEPKIFWFPVKDIKISKIFYKIQNLKY